LAAISHATNLLSLSLSLCVSRNLYCARLNPATSCSLECALEHLQQKGIRRSQSQAARCPRSLPLDAASDRLLLACLPSLATRALSVSPSLRTRGPFSPGQISLLSLSLSLSLTLSLSLLLVWIDYTIEYLLVGLSTRVFSLISCLNASRLATGRESFVAFVRHGKLGKLQEQGCAWCVTLLDFHVRTAFLGLCNALKGCEATPNSCVSFDSP